MSEETKNQLAPEPENLVSKVERVKPKTAKATQADSSGEATLSSLDQKSEKIPTKAPSTEQKEPTDEAAPGSEAPEEKPTETAEKIPAEISVENAAPEAKTDSLTELDPSLDIRKVKVRDGEKYIRLEDLPKEEKNSSQDYIDLEAMYLQTLTEIKEGTIVQGRIITITEKEVAVDIGFKSEGMVVIEEFDDPKSLNVGDTIEVYLDSVEDSEGQLLLSKKKADFMRVWERIKNIYAQDKIIKGKCVRRIKGGMVVDLGGVDAFLPGSQIDVRPIRDFEALISQEMDFRILKINDLRKNVVISRKVLIEEEMREDKERLLKSLKVDSVLEGVVKNITEFGVFVDLGGVDGLLHITDLSWGRVTHPSEVVQLDQRIKVKVLSYDEERQRISLGLKQLYAHLWEEIDKKYHIGQKIQGKIVSLAKYGAFVEIEPGIEGLVHISEMSWTQHIKHPSQIVHEGDHVQVIVLNIDKDSRKISLGLKQIEEDPWDNFEMKYRVGSHHKGVVRDLVPFGAFVELEDGIDGLVHISDLSWTKKVRHPGEILKKGQEIEIVVLAFDRNERRIALGLKQLEENPWDMFEREIPLKSRTSGTVTRTIDKGVLVELPYNLEGFVPNSQIAKKFYEGKKRSVQIGDVLKLLVLEFDKTERKVILSNIQAENKEEATMAATYLAKGGRLAPTIGDTLAEDNPLLEALKAAKAEEKTGGKGKKSRGKKAKKAEKAEEAAPDVSTVETESKTEAETQPITVEAQEPTVEEIPETEAAIQPETEAVTQPEVEEIAAAEPVTSVVETAEEPKEEAAAEDIKPEEANPKSEIVAEGETSKEKSEESKPENVQ